MTDPRASCGSLVPMSTPTGPPARFNLTRYCLDAARERPEETALLVVHGREGLAGLEAGTDAGVERWSFGELDDAVRAVAAGLLEAGLTPGDRVMIRLGDTSDYAIVHFGAMAAGLVSLPSSAQLTRSEAAFLLEDSGAAAIVDDGDLEAPGILRFTPNDVARRRASDRRIPYADTAADDPAFLVYTPGRRAAPRGSCTPTAPRGGGGRCTTAGTASGRMTSCCTPAPSTGPTPSASA